MKKTIAFLFAALASTAVFAEETVADAMTIKVYSFTVSKEAKYADGALLREGEMFMVVGVPQDCAFTGIDSNGKPLDDRVVVIVNPTVIKKGEVSEFQVNADLKLSPRVLVLDTRTYELAEEAELETAGGVRVSASRSKVLDLSVGVVVAYSLIACQEKDATPSQYMTVQGSLPAAQYVVQPRITGIKVADGVAELTIRGLNPAVASELTWSSAVDALSGKVAGVSVAGDATPSVDKVNGLRAYPTDEYRIWIPKKLEGVASDATFFKLEASKAE